MPENERTTSWWTLAFMAALALGAVIYTMVSPDGLLRLANMKGEVAKLTADNDAIEAENERVREKIERLRDDKEVLERAVREDLGYLKSEEVVFHFTESSTAPSEARH